MNREIITFGDTETEKNKFHCFKHRINIINVDIDRIIISKKILFCKNSFKCFIGLLVTKMMVYNASKNEWVGKRFCWK